MKANELRIGNCILKNGSNYIIDTLFFVDVYDGTVMDFELQPIPLTEEWLLKFGFEKDEEYDEAGLVDYRYELNINTASFTSNWNTEESYYVNYNQGGVDIFYVHQLQNLYFALTGEELTVKV